MRATFADHRARRTLLAALVAIMLGACGDGAATTSAAAADDYGEVIVIAAPDDDTAASGDQPPPAAPDPSPIASRNDLHNEARVVPLAVRVDPVDSRILHVTYAGGTDRCQGARMAIDEGPATVRVLVFVGTPPDGAGSACYPVGVVRELTATLERPLGSREILTS